MKELIFQKPLTAGLACPAFVPPGAVSHGDASSAKRGRLLRSVTGAALLVWAVFFAAVLPSCSTDPALHPRNYGSLGEAHDPLPFMTNARKGRLPSGLSYYILENTKPQGRAYLTLAVDAGAVLEQEHEQGLAHFVEHMAFNGTERFPEADLIHYLRSLGMRFGPEINAYTSYDETVFGIEVPVEEGRDGKRRIPEKALAILDDWTHAITFAPKDVDEERPVILEEYRQSLGAMDRIREKLLPLLFQGSPYAERQVIGLPEIIRTVPAEVLANFYHTWYRGDTMAVIFVGDFDGAALEVSLASHFTMEKPQTPLDHPRYDLPPAEKNFFQAEIITDPELPLGQINLYYKLKPSPPPGDLYAYRESLIGHLINSMLSFRFEEAVTRPETPYTWGDAGILPFGTSSRFFVFSAGAKTGGMEPALKALLREKESIVRYGFSSTEIERTKRMLLSNMERAVSEQDRQESPYYVNEFTSHFLRKTAVPDMEWEYRAMTELLPHIGEAEIAAHIKSFFTANDLRAAILSPEAERENLPSPEAIRLIVEAASREKIERPLAAAPAGSLLDQDPLPGAITSSIEDKASGTLVWTLSNGSRVIVKETSNKNNEVAFYALARGGLTDTGAREFASARFAAELLGASGAGPYTRTDLVRLLADKQISLNFMTSAFTRSFSGSSTRGDLKAFFELLYLTFTQPRVDQDAATVMASQYRTSLALKDENPQTYFSDELQKFMYGNNPYFRPLETADIDAISLDDIKAFAARALEGSGYTFVFTGNIDIEVLRSYTETYLASIPSGGTWKRLEDPRIERPGKTEKSLYKGREDQSAAFLVWFSPMDYSAAAAAAAQVLGEYLDIVLTEKIREALGGVYSISAETGLSPIPRGELYTALSFYCDPRRAEDLSAAVQNEVSALASGQVDQGVLREAIAALKMNQRQLVQDNSYLAKAYAQFAMLGMPLNQLDERPALFDRVSAAVIRNMAATLMRSGPARLILYPETNRTQN
ncbi:MAG: insulinase family protein [Spirochaetaceae bacterium]|jgi:zinc protease|nr:insulinase family protein [Spirochaetaceae bacterium]